MNLNLTKDELKANYEALRFLLRDRRTHDDPDARHLVSVLTKLQTLAKDVKCRHCDGRFSRRKSRLCDPCHAYEVKYGVLPDLEVLVRRRRRLNR